MSTVNPITTDLQTGDCLPILQSMGSASVDLVYMDPPFFTQKSHKQRTRDRSRESSFSDLWLSHSEYTNFMYDRLQQASRVLKETGSIFVHCDNSANHIILTLLHDIFDRH